MRSSDSSPSPASTTIRRSPSRATPESGGSGDVTRKSRARSHHASALRHPRILIPMPLAYEIAPSLALAPSLQPGVATPGAARVLILDEEALMRRALGNFLRRRGYDR